MEWDFLLFDHEINATGCNDEILTKSISLIYDSMIECAIL